MNILNRINQADWTRIMSIRDIRKGLGFTDPQGVTVSIGLDDGREYRAIVLIRPDNLYIEGVYYTFDDINNF